MEFGGAYNDSDKKKIRREKKKLLIIHHMVFGWTGESSKKVMGFSFM